MKLMSRSTSLKVAAFTVVLLAAVIVDLLNLNRWVGVAALVVASVLFVSGMRSKEA